MNQILLIWYKILLNWVFKIKEMVSLHNLVRDRKYRNWIKKWIIFFSIKAPMQRVQCQFISSETFSIQIDHIFGNITSYIVIWSRILEEQTVWSQSKLDIHPVIGWWKHIATDWCSFDYLVSRPVLVDNYSTVLVYTMHRVIH